PASDNTNRATIGIFTFNYYSPRAPFLPLAFPFQFYNTLSWMSLILLGVALVNMLPMFPFDGDRYFDTILGILGMKNTKNVRTIASIVSLLLLGSNLILSFVLFGTIFPKYRQTLQRITCSTCNRHTSYYRRENDGVNLCKGCFKD